MISDCDSFRLTLSKQNSHPRIARWAMFFQNYDFTIQHRPGKRMGHVDALSRCQSVLTIESNSFDRILSIQQDRDPDICRIRDDLEKNESKLFELRDGLVYRKDKDKLLFFVPSSMISNVLRTCHDDIGHVGIDKVIHYLTRVYWFPNMRNTVKEYISNCLKCLEFSPMSGKREGFLHSIPKGDTPFHTVHLDHYGPLEKSTRGYKHIFAIIDGFTKFIRLYPCKSTDTEEVIKHLKDYFRCYSKPFRIISDRGSCFTSQLFERFVSEESVVHVLVATGTPRANGQIERFNRMLTPMLAKLVENPSDWDNVLNKVEYAMNNTVCRSTGETPSRLLFGLDQLGEVNDTVRLFLQQFNNEQARDLDQVRQQASEVQNHSQLLNEVAYNQRHKASHEYCEGNYVLIKNVDTTAGVNKKLLPKFKGPFIIKKCLGKDRYVITDIPGFQLNQAPFETVVGSDQMKLWLSS